MKSTQLSKNHYPPFFKMVAILLKEALIILGIYALGEGIVYALDTPFPGSVVGMLILLSALHLKWIKVDDIRLLSSWLLAYMPLFFIPAGVSVMVSYTLMQGFSLAIVSIIMLSTVLVMVVTGKLVGYLVQREQR